MVSSTDMMNRIETFKHQISCKGVTVLGEKKLEYGIQLVLEDENFELLKVNIYSSKKGISCIVSKQKGSLYTKIKDDIETIELKSISCHDAYIGSDESGKGDYFGPLVIAAVASNQYIDDELAHLNVKDSKNLSDKQVRNIAAEILKQIPMQVKILSIEPEKYNERYSKGLINGEKLNSLLGYGHGTVIGELYKEHRDTKIIIADQFAESNYLKPYINNEEITKLKMMPRAEVYSAVAAASILARSTYLHWLEEHSDAVGILLTKGCGSDSVFAAKEIVKKYGKEELRKYCKLHFKTTCKVMEDWRN